MKKRSREITGHKGSKNWVERSAARAMLRAVRFNDDDFEKPLIAMIQGYCLGGGLGLAMTADLRVAAEDAVFGIPAARLSIAYDFFNLTQLVHLVGPAKAKEILLTARRYTARDAANMGLVNTVVPVADLASVITDLTENLVVNAPLSLKANKMAINEVLKDPEARDMAKVRRLEQVCFDSDDYREGRAAFMEKRKPVFTGT